MEKVRKFKNLLFGVNSNQAAQTKELVNEGSEKAFLTQVKAKSCNGNSNTLENLIKTYYNEEEILKLLEDPEKFFNLGWFFVSDKEVCFRTFMFVNGLLMGDAYYFNNFLPNKFWENPKLVKKFLECSDKYWLDLINKTPINKSFLCYQLGFKMAVVHAQVKAIQRLQEAYTNHAMIDEKYKSNTPEMAKL